MKEWFDMLEVRERLFVLVGALFVAGAIVYYGIWSPLDRGQATLAANVSALQRSLAELKPLKAALGNSGGSASVIAGGNQSLVVIVDMTLRERGLYSALQRSQPTRDNGIRVEFENAPFDDLILWLGDLGNRYGLQAISGSFSAPMQDSQGRVNASLTLER
ncbi:MAG: type II secretion system protein M [Proteobacteria bacterium]|nr:type II secretion system protein M [Pseudomonadota bacterium]